jgi:hypothetical protein
MSPHRQLSISSHRHPTEINEIFLGLGLKLHDTPPPSENDSDTSARASGGEPSGDGVRDMEYSLVLHDGTGVTESETYHYPFPGKGTDAEGINKAAIKFSREVLGRILELQRTKSMDVRVVAGAQPIPDELQASKGIEWMASVWLHLDAIPYARFLLHQAGDACIATSDNTISPAHSRYSGIGKLGDLFCPQIPPSGNA